MKRKISILLVGLLTVGLMGGCGNTKVTIKDSQDKDIAKVEIEENQENSDAKSNEVDNGIITVSQMLNLIVDEKGQVSIYQMQGSETKDHVLDKDDKVAVLSYDGKTIKRYFDKDAKYEEDKTYKIGEVAQGVAEIPSEGSENWFSVQDNGYFSDIKYDSQKIGMAMNTDASGNNADVEALYATITGSCLYSDEEVENEPTDFETTYCINFSSSFQRYQIYNQSYMVFRTTRGDGTNVRDIYYTIIQDTESTIDKTVVLDEVGTDGIVVDSLEDLKGYYTY